MSTISQGFLSSSRTVQRRDGCPTREADDEESRQQVWSSLWHDQSFRWPRRNSHRVTLWFAVPVTAALDRITIHGTVMTDFLRDLIQRWRSDAGATYRTWFLWEERLKNFRSIRRGLETVVAQIESGTFGNVYKGSALETVVGSIAAGGSVVELGCGYGYNLGRLAEIKAKYDPNMYPLSASCHVLAGFFQASRYSATGPGSGP